MLHVALIRARVFLFMIRVTLGGPIGIREFDSWVSGTGSHGVLGEVNGTVLVICRCTGESYGGERVFGENFGYWVVRQWLGVLGKGRFSPWGLIIEVMGTVENKDPYVSNLDESAILVTPLSEANEDECFDPGGNIDEINADVFMDIEDVYHDSEGYIIYLESLLINDTILNLPSKVFLDHEPRSLKDEPDNDDLKRYLRIFLSKGLLLEIGYRGGNQLWDDMEGLGSDLYKLETSRRTWRYVCGVATFMEKKKEMWPFLGPRIQRRCLQAAWRQSSCIMEELDHMVGH
nr:hypothetical protein [Tanacetum cinerariifolium]